MRRDRYVAVYDPVAGAGGAVIIFLVSMAALFVACVMFSFDNAPMLNVALIVMSMPGVFFLVLAIRGVIRLARRIASFFHVREP